MMRIATLALLVATVTGGCLPHPGGFSDAEPLTGAPDTDYAAPQLVTIDGYGSDAMEPFLTRDGQYLLFNDRNDAATDTNLYFATRSSDDGLHYTFGGLVAGANSASLDAVASVDRDGELVFVSTRSYDATMSTLYGGAFAAGAVAPVSVALVPGVSRDEATAVNFDAEISADGTALYFVDGVIDPGAPLPADADLVIADRATAGFLRRADSASLLANINSRALEYAPATSDDQLELFFTRFDPDAANPRPAIYHATRASPDAPFGVPSPIAAIPAELVEGPTVSSDGRMLCYHELDGALYAIHCVTRDVLASQRPL